MKNVKAIILEVKDLNSNILGPKYIFDVKLSDFKHTQEIQEAIELKALTVNQADDFITVCSYPLKGILTTK